MASEFLTRSDTNVPVQSQKQANAQNFRFRKKRHCAIRIAKAKVLISFCAADLRLCFCIGKNLVFL